VNADSDRALAEDLVQESCLALVRALITSADASVDVGWLMVVLRRRYVDHVRRSQREASRFARLAAADEGSEPDWSGVGEGRALTALGKLPGAQRAALVFRYVDDLPVREVAEMLGRTVSATESLLARGRRALARELPGDLDG
jgi:RNA polymerase sigma-70 factor (ECF subfamily)